MTLSTRLTQRFDIAHPIISAPMAFAAGGRLAAAVTSAGGLGLIGGGYGDAAWLENERRAAGNAQVGYGFITWSLRTRPELLEQVLAYRPRAIFLSFGNPQPFVAPIKAAGVALICQVQTRRDAEHAIDCAADVIVAQGSEAGGHGDKRATFTLVPEIADLITARAPQTLLCAAGGVGRRTRTCRRADARCRRRAGRLAAVGLAGGERQPGHACSRRRGYRRRHHTLAGHGSGAQARLAVALYGARPA